MNILVGFENSQEVLAAFMALGHTGMSCDLNYDGAKGLPHYRGDIFDVLGRGWDLVIAHPPCTALAVSGNRWYAGTKEREEAIRFVERIWFFDGYRGKLCIENPVGVLSSMSKLGVATQYIQPYQFGEDASKKTGLWLRDLPKLRQTEYYPPRMVCKICGKTYSYDDEFKNGCWQHGPGLSLPRWGNQTDSGQNALPPSEGRQKERSKTYTGIAQAMAMQWSK